MQDNPHQMNLFHSILRILVLLFIYVIYLFCQIYTPPYSHIEAQGSEQHH